MSYRACAGPAERLHPMKRPLAFSAGMAAAWALAGLLGALLYSSPGLMIALTLGGQAAHLPLRQLGMWVVGGALTAALLWKPLGGRAALTVGAGWALVGPFTWRPGPLFAEARSPALDTDFAFYPVGVAAAALLTAWVVRRVRPASGRRALWAAFGWVAGQGLFSLLTGYGIPLYVLRARAVNMGMGLLFGAVFGLCGALGLWAALRGGAERQPQPFVRPNPLVGYLVRGGPFTVGAAAVMLAASCGAALLLEPHIMLSLRGLPPALRALPLLPMLGLAAPALLTASAGAALTNAGGARQWMQLLPLAGMPRRQIAWSYLLGVLARLRGLFVLMLGLAPLLVWVTAEVWGAAVYTAEPLPSTLMLALLALGFFTLSVLGAAVGVWLSLRYGPSPLWVAVAPLLTAALALVPLALLLTMQPLSATRGIAEAAGLLVFVLWPLLTGWELLAAVERM